MGDDSRKDIVTLPYKTCFSKPYFPQRKKVLLQKGRWYIRTPIALQTVAKVELESVQLFYFGLQSKSLPQDDPKRRHPDITRAKAWLGWEPKVPVQEGLDKMISDFRSRLAPEAASTQNVADGASQISTSV